MATRHVRSASIGEYISYHIYQLTAAGTANPATQAAGTAGTSGSLATGTYYVTYSYVNSNGQSLAAPISAAISVTGPSGSIATTAVTPPGGYTVNWYVGQTNNANSLQYVTNNSGASYTITALPASSAATPYQINTTAPRTGLPSTAAQAAAAGTDILDYGHGVYIGSLSLNIPGSSTTLTIFNGNSGTPGSVIAQIQPTTNATLHFDAMLENGFYYSYTGTTAGSLTLGVLPAAV